MKCAEMFSGIGGFRFGLEKTNQNIRWWQNKEGTTGQENIRPDLSNTNDSESRKEYPENIFRCVWANDFDKYACQIYRKHYGEKELVEGDIRQISTDDIPDFDLLTAGFPCQSFSLAGKRKGFQDIRGTLFYEVVRVASAKRPKLLLLENVKGLLSNDDGKTFGTILEELGNIGYWCEWQTLNSKHFGVPQNRERVFIVGHLRTEPTKQIFPVGQAGEGVDESCGETQDDGSRVRDVHSLGNIYPSGGEAGNIIDTSGIFPTLKQGKRGGKAGIPPIANPLGVGGSFGERNLIVQKHRKDDIRVYSENAPSLQSRDYKEPNLVLQQHSHSGEDGKGRGIREYEGIVPALTQQMGTGGNNIPMVASAVDCDGYLRTGTRPRDEQGKPQLLPIGYRRIRRLTPTECERLQGFPDGWTEGVSDTQRYKLLGNAVTTNVISFLGEKLLELKT